MSRMLWYEWKRIWQSRLTQLAVIGCGIFLVFCVWSSIVQMTAVDMNGNQVSGMQAAEVLQDTQERITLDQETVNKLLEEYISYTEDPQTGSDDPDLLYLSEEIYRTWYLPRQELFRIIGGIYIKPENVQESVGDTLQKSVGVHFYDARSERLMERLTTLYQNGTITAEEADWWVEKDASVDEYIFGYSKAWQQILTTGSWIVLIMVIVCVGIAPVFAGEYQSKCDSLLLSMRFGKNRLILAKLVSSFLYTSVVYWGITLLYSAVYLMLLGTRGWDLPIQINYPSVSVSYDLNMMQACGLLLLLGYLLTLGMAGITLLLSALLKNSYSVIIIVFLLLLIPTFLSLDAGNYLWKHMLALLPAKIADFSFTSYLAYRAGSLTVAWPEMAMTVNGIVAVICLVIAYGVFRNHQVNK